MAKRKTNNRIFLLCKNLASLVFKEYNGKENAHFDNLKTRLDRAKMPDLANQALENIAAIVTVGLETRGNLTEDMLDTLEEEIKRVLSIIDGS